MLQAKRVAYQNELDFSDPNDIMEDSEYYDE